MPTYKTVNKKYSKIPAKLAEKIPWNKLCVDLIVPYKIRKKSREYLILTAVKIIDPVTRSFEITQYKDKKAMMIVKLVETTWLVRYPWPLEITYD